MDDGVRGTVGTGRLLLHTTMAMVAAFLLTILLHESAHSVAALMFGSPVRQVPFASMPVAHLSETAQTVVTLAGPAFSLVLGVVLVFFVRPGPIVGSGHLFAVWFAFINVMEGGGYLVLTPFGIGDTGEVAARYGLQNSVGWIALAAGGGITVLCAIGYARRMTGFVPPGDVRGLLALSFHPWMIGLVVTVGLTLLWAALSVVKLGPGDMIAVAMGAVALGVWAPMAMSFSNMRSAKENAGSDPIRLGPFPWTSTIIAVLVCVVNVLLLSGPTIGG
ncbi:zinc metalloprotease [Microbacterium gorillae]|uniref:hypothetical protein n=1 Tax=Microbacterium gorillae TaxID=1231063 RepID=UPI000694B968|nr:hypothetical protein [Microbacterium gorillae]